MMNERTFYEYVIAHVDNAEVIERAKAKLSAIQARSDKRAAENEPIKEAIAEALANGVVASAAEIAEAIGSSTSKVASLCKAMRAEGTVLANEVVKGSKVQRTYYLA